MTDLADFEDAACAGRWELMDAPTARIAAAARRLCAGCPTRSACAELASQINPEAGVWAGVAYGLPGRKPRA